MTLIVANILVGGYCLALLGLALVLALLNRR